MSHYVQFKLVGRGTRDQIVNICWIIEKAREFQENIYFSFIDYVKAFDCVDHNELWNILKEVGIPDRPMQVKKQQLEPDTEQSAGSKLGKEYVKDVYYHPVYLTYAEFIRQNVRLDEAQAGIKIVGKSINNLRYSDDTTFTAESEEELMSLLIKVKEENENVDLKLSVQKQRSWHLVPSLHGK